MKEEPDHLPAVGPSARTLGVRPGNSITPDVLATNSTDMILPGQGGMSVAPDDPHNLERHRRPASLGGTGRDPVWYIEIEDLEPDLYYRQDRPTHGVIEPKHGMTLQEYQDALAGTRSKWKLFIR